MSCICEGTGWVVTERGAASCKCRNQRIEASQAGTPITAAAIAQAVEALGDTLAFFPKGLAGRAVIGDAVSSMCGTVEQARYMVRRAVALYKTWDRCGIPGLRQIICHSGIPADGVMLSITESFPEGLPPERVGPPMARLLPPGPKMDEARQIEATVGAIAKKVPPPRNVDIHPLERTTPHRGITQADIDRAVEENRQRRAEAELEAR